MSRDSRDAYDQLYSKIDMAENPLGYLPEYVKRRHSEVTTELAGCVKNYGKALDVGKWMATTAIGESSAHIEGARNSGLVLGNSET